MTRDHADDDLPTLAAIGVVAFMVVTAAHQLVGHGLGCLVDGGAITRVSTVYFRCEGGGAATDFAGPLGNLGLGLVALGLIASRRVVYREGRLFALLVAGLTLFWAFAQLMLALFDPRDDWRLGAGASGWPPAWRFGGALVAIIGYDVTRRAMTRGMRTLSTGYSAAADRRRFLTPWLAGLVAAMGAAVLFAPDRLGSLARAALALGAAPLGLVVAVVMASRLGPSGEESPKPIRRRWSWIFAAGLAYAIWSATLGVGLGAGRFD